MVDELESSSSEEEFDFGPYAAIRRHNRVRIQARERPFEFVMNGQRPVNPPHTVRRNAIPPARPSALEEVQVEEGWQCPICLEADGGRIVFHACGNRHAFHQACLDRCVRRDCPLCRGEPRLRQELVHVGLQRVMLTSSTACVFCLRLCLGPHVAVDACGHRLHDECAMSVLTETGVPRDGLLRCPRCRR